MIGSAYFAGYSISCLVVPRLADIYGRRMPYIVSTWIQLILYFGIYFSKSLMMTLTLILIFGFCGAGRSAVGYLYLIEMVPSRWKTLAGTLMHSVNSLTFVFSAIYFWFVSKEWRWLIIYAICANIITCIAILFIPESPLYCHSIRDYDKARTSISKIAKFNKYEGFSLSDALFEEEAELIKKEERAHKSHSHHLDDK